jgi:hypothetical protein
LIRWRGIYNYETRIIRADKCAARPGNDDNQDDGVQKKRSRDDSAAAQGSGKKRDFKGGKGKDGKKKPFVQRRVKVAR